MDFTNGQSTRCVLPRWETSLVRNDSVPTSSQPSEKHSTYSSLLQRTSSSAVSIEETCPTLRSNVNITQSRNDTEHYQNLPDDWDNPVSPMSHNFNGNSVIALDEHNDVADVFDIPQRSHPEAEFGRRMDYLTTKRHSKLSLSQSRDQPRGNYQPTDMFSDNLRARNPLPEPPQNQPRGNYQRTDVFSDSLRARNPVPEPQQLPTRAPLATQVPELRPSLGIKVRVQDNLLLIPLKCKDQTFGSLSRDVSDRYCRQFGIKPTLTLHTKDGAILIDSDPVSLIFGCDELSTSVKSWNIPSLMERYEESCKRLDVVGDPHIKRCLSVSSGSLVISELALKPQLLAPVFQAIHEQDRLTHLDLSGNVLADKGVKLLAECLPRLQQLKELNLSCNCITSQGLKHLSEAFQPPDIYQPVQVTDPRRLLQNLTVLDLSHNFLSGDESWTSLSNILDVLSLRTLHLQCCHLKSFNADFPPLLSLETVANLDISFNPLGCEGVSSFLGRLSTERLVSINMAATAEPNSPGSVTRVLRLFLERNNPAALQSLDLSNNNINDTDILEVLKLLGNATQFESLYLRQNPDLTSISLKVLLQKCIGQSPSNLDLTGCWNIYDDLDKATVLQHITENELLLGLKTLTLSTNKINQARNVEELWSEVYGGKAVIQKGPFGMLRLSKN